MATRKQYNITLLLEGAKTKDSDYTWMDYHEAFTRAGESLQRHEDAWGILIHSDHKTAIVVTRKHFPGLFKK
jgi:hypothetical protein